MSDDKTQEGYLYAGKYKTVAELEEGYKKSLPTFQENEVLKKQLQESTKIPDMYSTPSDIALHESDLEIVKAEAKNSNLTQAQYERLVKERNARSLSKHQSYEDAKKELGADNINLIQDFLKKSYPEKVADKLLNDAIVNKEIRQSILDQRQQALNSGVPGLGRIVSTGSFVVTEKDVLKARDEMHNSRGKAKVEAQKRYVSMQRERAHQKNAT